MKRFSVAALALAASLLAVPVAAQDTNTEADRAAAVKYLDQTREAFLKSIEGLTEAQWKFKAAPDRWSIAEVAEHIALSEDTIFGMITTKMLQAPAPTGPRTPDEKVIAGLTDRTQKFQAPEVLKPVNKWASREELTKAFNASRAKTIDWVKTTKEDLRAHAAPHPAFGSLDAHQWVLLQAGHSARHTLQIEEVKQQAGYPK